MAAAAVAPFLGHRAIHSPFRPKHDVKTMGKNRLDLDHAMSSLDCGEEATRGRDFYNSLVSLCVSEKALAEGNRLRAHLVAAGRAPGIFVANQFLNLYMRCGEVDTAREMFDGMPEKNTVSWNAMISGYCANGCFLDALRLFNAMVEMGWQPTQPTYLGALQACVGFLDLGYGEQIHAHAVKAGSVSEIQVGNSLISMYSKLGRTDDAMMVFDKLGELRDIVSWNSVIAANAQNGHGDRAILLLVDLLEEGLAPNEFSFGSLLGSKDVVSVRELHSYITKYGLHVHVILGSALVDAYARCGLVREAFLVFSMMPERNTVTWNSAIAACVENNMAEEGLRLYLQMGQMGFLPDIYTIASLLGAAAVELPIAAGIQFHGIAAKLGFCSDALVGNTLITMYSKHGLVPDCTRAFEGILEPDIISLNSLIQSYVQNERHEEALVLFQEMTCSGIERDEFCFMGALAACTSLGWTETGRQVHGDLVKSGLTVNAFVGSALIDLYAEYAAIEEAKVVFSGIAHKDLIAWNSMIIALAQNGCLDQTMTFFSMMRDENLQPDMFTFTGVLAGCADSSAVQVGRQVHALLLKSELTVDAAVANSLITMYTRCGSVSEAEVIFSGLTDKNMVSWTTMIGGYARAGFSKKAIELFNQMESIGVRPNSKTLLALLTACSYAGLTSEAENYFSLMEKKYGIKPEFEHYACMVDVYSRAGRLEEAEFLINCMPYEATALVWQMLLSACRLHGDLDRGRRSMEKIVELEPCDSGAYVLLSNLYAALGKWDGVEQIRNMMRENGVTKEPGKSWIEVQDRVHEFRAGDRSHPLTGEIYSKLRELTSVVKESEYFPTIVLDEDI